MDGHLTYHLQGNEEDAAALGRVPEGTTGTAGGCVQELPETPILPDPRNSSGELVCSSNRANHTKQRVWSLGQRLPFGWAEYKGNGIGRGLGAYTWETSAL